MVVRCKSEETQDALLQRISGLIVLLPLSCNWVGHDRCMLLLVVWQTRRRKLVQPARRCAVPRPRTLQSDGWIPVFALCIFNAQLAAKTEATASTRLYLSLDSCNRTADSYEGARNFRFEGACLLALLAICQLPLWLVPPTQPYGQQASTL